MANKQLYFIALIPHEQLRAEVKALKEEMRDRFKAKHALKSPAHLTLQMPFRWDPDQEQKLVTPLTRFASGQTSFQVKLNGFDCFAPRVIFIHPGDPEPIRKVHSALRLVLINELGFDPNRTPKQINPHLTIATRDLTPEAFATAWPEYQKRPFDAEFEVKSLFLLKHNGRFWDIYREFLFATA